MTETQKKLLDRAQRKLQRLREDVEVLADAADGIDAVSYRGIAARIASIAMLIEDRHIFAPDGVTIAPVLEAGDRGSP